MIRAEVEVQCLGSQARLPGEAENQQYVTVNHCC